MSGDERAAGERLLARDTDAVAGGQRVAHPARLARRARAAARRRPPTSQSWAASHRRAEDRAARHGRLVARPRGAAGRRRLRPPRRARHHRPRARSRRSTLDDAFFLVSSKSGGTLEVQTLLAHFWSKVPDGTPLRRHHRPRHRRSATWPGSAASPGCSRTRPDIGGRYSVLSLLRPRARPPCSATTSAELCERAARRRRRGGRARSAIAMGRRRAGRARTRSPIRIAPERFAAFGLWVEQLVAESTGKQGKGCVPVPTTEAETGRRPLQRRRCRLGDAARPRRRVPALGDRHGHRRPRARRRPVRRAQRDRVQGEHRAGAGLAAAAREPSSTDPSGVSEWLADVSRGRATTSRCRPTCPTARTTRFERCGAGCATGSAASPSPPATAPASSTPPASCTRAAPTTSSPCRSCRRQPTANARRSPASTYDFGTLIAAQALGDHQSLVRARPARRCASAADRPAGGVVAMQHRHGRPRPHGRQHDQAAARARATRSSPTTATPTRWPRASPRARSARRRSRTWSAKLEPPRAVWVMVPAGDADPDDDRPRWAACCPPGDTVIDGGNSQWKDALAQRAGARRQRASPSSTPACPAACGGSRSATA